MQVTFHGVRGSTPAVGAETSRYGGNTACVSIDAAGCPPIVIDLGTGIRNYGATVKGAFEGILLLTHLHWDHIQGLPFFAPLLSPLANARLIGPPQPGEGSLRDVLARVVRPPFFPVALKDLCVGVSIEELDRGQIQAGSASITAARVDHPGPTNAYRVDHDGVSVAYVSDHQQPVDGAISAELLRLVDGVDLLIHDAQYTDDEFVDKSDWGHSTVGFAVEVALAAGVGTLALFHHDPSRDDDGVDELLGLAQAMVEAEDLTVIAASEGLTVAL